MEPLGEQFVAAFKLGASGDSDGAIKLLDSSFKQAVAEGQTRWIRIIGGTLAIRYQIQNRLSEALECLTKMVEHAPNDRLVWYELGDVLSRLGDDKEAEAAFRKSLTLSLQEN